MLRKIAVFDQLHNHVQVLGRLKRVLERQDEWVRQLPHNLSLCDCVPDLVVCDDELFVDRLHSIKFPRKYVFNAMHFAEGPLAKFVENFKTRKFYRGSVCGRSWLAGCERLVVALTALFVWVCLHDFGVLHKLVLIFGLLLLFLAVYLYLLESLPFFNYFLLVQKLRLFFSQIWDLKTLVAAITVAEFYNFVKFIN